LELPKASGNEERLIPLKSGHQTTSRSDGRRR
jgi:hypothetical protein